MSWSTEWSLPHQMSVYTTGRLTYLSSKLTATSVQHINQISYLLTPCSRVLLEKLTGSAASQEIPRIFGTRRFITVLTSARHLSLS